MNLLEGISSAFSNVLSHKLRSALTMLGIIIGIAAVIMITAVGAGVKNSVFSVINTINRNFVDVYYMGSEEQNMLTMDDIETIKAVPNVDKVAPYNTIGGVSLRLRVPGKLEDGMLSAMDENYSLIEKVEIFKGRFFTANDVANRSMVAVIKPSTAVQVFGRVDCLGEKIEVESYMGTQEFTVIGLLDEGEKSALSDMVQTPLLGSLAVIPITTFLDLYSYDGAVNLGVSVKDIAKTVETSENITAVLDASHGTKDDYQVQSMSSMFDQLDVILNGITAFVAFVAAISLFVGGVGVMNIMLVTVRERTREIGIRKSLGATRGVIRLQFVLEASILTIIGGLIGLVLGAFGANGIGVILTGFMQMEVTPIISPAAVIIAIAVSTLVGIIFGVYPAGKAAKLDPVEALRYE